MHNLPAGTLVVVADGTKARLLRNVGDDRKPRLHQEALLRADDMALQGPSGSAPEEQTPQQTREASFAKHLARHLNDSALKQGYAHLVLMADPQTLGQVRPQLHQETLKRLRAEVAKDLSNAPLEDIGAALH